MKPERSATEVPLWRDEFSVHAAEERYVSRRQFGKFLVLTSLGMFAGNLWILVRSWMRGQPAWLPRVVARASEVPVSDRSATKPGASGPQ